MWVDYRGSLSTVCNDGEYMWVDFRDSLSTATMMGRSQHVGRL